MDTALVDNVKFGGRITPVSPSARIVALELFAPVVKRTTSLHVAGAVNEPPGCSNSTTSPGTTKIPKS
jgi:hypothetical protein